MEIFMFERLKNLYNGLTFVWKHGGIIRSVTTAWSSYPGLNDPDLLRLWVRPLLLDVATLTSLTPTTIDDMIAHAAIRLVDNNHTWTAIHSLALLGRDSGYINGVRVPQNERVASASELFEAITTETPENPALVLSAIGLILYLIQQLSRK
jgi:hypothetical protein